MNNVSLKEARSQSDRPPSRLLKMSLRLSVPSLFRLYWSMEIHLEGRKVPKSSIEDRGPIPGGQGQPQIEQTQEE